MAAPTRELLATFDRLHAATLGARAALVPGKDAKILARLWSTHGEFVDDLMLDYFNSRDPFIIRQGYSVGKFAGQFSMLLARRVRAERSTKAVSWKDECERSHSPQCLSYQEHFWKVQRAAKSASA